MKLRDFFLGLLFVATTTEAQLSTAKSTTSVAPATHYSIGQCHFAINDLQKGAFTSDNTVNPPAGGYTGLLAIDNPVFVMFCYPGASNDEIDNQLGARKVEGKWVWLNTGEPFEPDQNFKILEFSRKNWEGRGITYDDTTGDEAIRQRRFNFCLLQTGGSQVLCGNSSVMPLGYPKSNVLPKIMAVLKSVEFLDLPAPANFACDSVPQKQEMANRLFLDGDMRAFVCASETCTKETFLKGVTFQKIEESFHGSPVEICLVEPVLSATNSYIGVFAGYKGNIDFQFISYGAGIKISKNNSEIPMLHEYGAGDPEDDNSTIALYIWNGKKFVFNKNVSLRK